MVNGLRCCRESIEFTTIATRRPRQDNRGFKQSLEKFCARTTLAFVEYRIVRSGTQKFGFEKAGCSQNAIKLSIWSCAHIKRATVAKVQVPCSTGVVNSKNRWVLDYLEYTSKALTMATSWNDIDTSGPSDREASACAVFSSLLALYMEVDQASVAVAVPMICLLVSAATTK